MRVHSEQTKEVIRFLGIVLMVIINNHVKEELGVNRVRESNVPEWVTESFEKNDRQVEIPCTWTLIYEGKRPEPCPIESYTSYRLYKGWKKRNGL